jgi:hypothetical protein
MQLHLPALRTQRPLLLVLLACAALCHPVLRAQDAAAQAPPAPPGAGPMLFPVSPAPSWAGLLEPERQILQPLAGVWDSLSPAHQRKWLSMVKNYNHLKPADQSKLRERMTQWALLTPKERQLARLNFAESKKLNAGERSSNWENYQALTDAERSALAKLKPSSPTGAAIAPKPIPKEKLATIAVTRHSSDNERAAASAIQPIDRKTLLPLRPASPVKPTPDGA